MSITSTASAAPGSAAIPGDGEQCRNGACRSGRRWSRPGGQPHRRQATRISPTEQPASGALGFFALAGLAATIAKVLFLVFLVLLVVSFFSRAARGRSVV